MISYHQLKIGLDYHGVINTNPRYFKYFSNSLLQRGHELHIITGGPQKIIAQQLLSEEIQYTKLFTIVDYYRKQGKVEYFVDGSFKVDDDLWNRAKAEYCRLNNISLHIDDSLVYGGYFSTPYCLYDKVYKNCKISTCGSSIDLHTLPPTQAVIYLENILFN